MRRVERSFWRNWTVDLLVLALWVVVLFGAVTFPAYGDLLAYSDPKGLAKRGFGVNMASNAPGEVVVVWESGSSLLAQGFDSSGEPRGVVAEIPLVSISSPRLPAVGIDDRGRFALAWRYETIFSDPGGPIGSFFLQLFDAQANPVSDIFQPFAFELPVSEYPSLVMAGDGSFWVAARDGVMGSEASIFLRGFDSQGNPLTEPLQVSSPTQRPSQAPLLAQAPDGRLAVLTSDCHYPTCTHPSLRAQFLDALGAPLGEALEITDQGFGYGLAWVPGQGFVALWLRPADPELPMRHQAFALEGRVFSEASLGAVFTVKGESDGEGVLFFDADTGLGLGGKVAVDSLGNLVVAWEEVLVPLTESGVYARALNAQWQAQGPIVEISAGSGQRARRPAVASLGPGRFSLAWSVISIPFRIHLFEQKFLVTDDDCLPASTALCP
ncbi:MAG: hypothetical protein K0U98_13940 [Deltaproteobacteria bacterium]|nr:hypothetical protein [Deltaproteobacteria bacterium]